MLTFFAALNDEIKLIKADIEQDSAIHIKPFSIYTGKLGTQKIAIVRTGIGKENMKKAVDLSLKYIKPTLMVNIGYAGGLDPHLQAGDIVFSNQVIDEQTGETWDVETEHLKKLEELAKSLDARYHTGKSITVDKAITDPHQKAFLGTKFEAISCDMESSGLAVASKESGIPFVIVRSILDPMDILIPEIPEEAVKDGGVKVGEMLSHLKSNPKDILKLPKLSYLCSQARISLTNFIKEWVGSSFVTSR